MRKMIVLAGLMLVSVSVQAQSQSRINKAASKMSGFFNVKEVKSITALVKDRDPQGIISDIQYGLAEAGIKSVSPSVAKRRLLQLEASNNKLDINGPSIELKSSYVLLTEYVWNCGFSTCGIMRFNVQIVDLSDGNIVGGIRYKGSPIGLKVASQAMVKKLVNLMKNNK